jgi:hypothetical protein
VIRPRYAEEREWGKTLPRPDEIHRCVVEREGWIDLPTPGSLTSLAGV